MSHEIQAQLTLLQLRNEDSVINLLLNEDPFINLQKSPITSIFQMGKIFFSNLIALADKLCLLAVTIYFPQNINKYIVAQANLGKPLKHFLGLLPQLASSNLKFLSTSLRKGFLAHENQVRKTSQFQNPKTVNTLKVRRKNSQRKFLKDQLLETIKTIYIIIKQSNHFKWPQRKVVSNFKYLLHVSNL